MFFYTFLPKLLNMSLTASVVIVVVLLLRLPLRRAPKIISYALWGVVLFRLLCPVSLTSAVSLFSLLDAPAAGSRVAAAGQHLSGRRHCLGICLGTNKAENLSPVLA